MKKMAAILAVLMAAVMVMGMTASAEAYEEPVKWLSASEAVTIPNSAAAIDGHLQKDQISIGFLGCDDSAANNNQTGRLDIRNLFDVLASGYVTSW